MPGPMKNPMPSTDVPVEFTVFDSPLKSAPGCASSIDIMLEKFQEGLFETSEGKEAFHEIRRNETSMLGVLDPLLRVGLAGGSDAYPSVDDMIKTGKRVMIIEPDGTRTNFSDKYFLIDAVDEEGKDIKKPNATVAKLKEMEQNPRQKYKAGRLMAIYLGVFLGDNRQHNLKNVEKAFGGAGPADPESKMNVAIILPSGDVLLPESPEAKKTREDFDKLMKQHTDVLKNIPAESVAPEKKPVFTKQEPVIPPKPKERNIFRRFFCSIGWAKHSQEYNDRKAEWMAKTEEHAQCKAEEEQFRKDSEKYAQDVEARKKAEQAADKLTEQINADPSIRKTLNVMEEVVKPMMQAKANSIKSERANIYSALKKPAALENLNKSEAVVFQAGSVRDMVNLLEQHKSSNELAKAHVPITESMQKAIRREYFNNVSQFINKTNWVKVQAMANKAHEKLQAAEEKNGERMPEDKAKEYMQQYFDAQVSNAHKNQQDSCARAFESIFSMKCNVENVQKVADAVNLENLVRRGLKDIDHEVADASDPNGPENYKLPKVDARNCKDMTVLLMCGIKTLANPEKVRADAVISENTELALYRGGQQPEDPKAEDVGIQEIKL